MILTVVSYIITKAQDGEPKTGDSESILNGKLKAKLNRLYQCLSKILFITIVGHCFTTYPGSGRTFTTYMGWGLFNDIPWSLKLESKQTYEYIIS